MRVIVAGGGTGGHVFPGLAVARALLAEPDTDVLYVGSSRGLEATVVPAAGIRLIAIDVRQVRGGGLRRAVVGMFAAAIAMLSARRALRRFRPDVVVGVGGYASVPMVVAAWLTGIPTVLLEQNVIPGATNRLLGRFAAVVCVSFPETATTFPGRRVVCTGNPIRAEVAAIGAARADRPAAAASAPITVLVIGGSAGAHRLNVDVVEAFGRLGEQRQRVRVIHQTGAADEEATRAGYAALGLAADVRAFFDDMSAVYVSVDLAVCRAGATTIAELLAIGVPAVLVPYPYAADDHQRRNAEAVAAVEAGILILERDLTPERLAKILAALLDDSDRRAAMSAAARAMSRPEASRLVVAECRALARGGRRARPG